MTHANNPETKLSIRLLGGKEITIDGAPLPEVPGKVALLLAALVLKAGKETPTKIFASWLWPNATPEQAGRNLNRSVWQLRAALGSEVNRLPDPKKLSRNLSLSLDDAFVDVFAFDKAAAADNRAALEQAVELYRGPLLDSITGASADMDAWISQERSRRRRAYRAALKRLTVLCQSEGDTEAAQDYRQRLAEDDPKGDSAESVLLPDQSGNGNSAPGAGTISVRPEPPAPPREEPLVSIPCAFTELIGRQEEVAKIAATLKRHRLVTLKGPGGVGKTRLGMEVAEALQADYEDGAVFVELDALAHPALVLRAVAAKLQIKEEAEGELLTGLRNCLKSKKFLLVLDNCEHLLHACAQLARALLTFCPHLRILTTSRTTLGINGERVLDVPSLPAPKPSEFPEGEDAPDIALQYPAIQLFEQRAQDVRESFQVSGKNVREVVEICHHLDGIPLAIEIVAVRTQAMPLKVIAQQLREFVQPGEDGDRTVSRRHQTLYSLIDWSYNLLSEPERCMLRRLSAFRGGWAMKSVQSLYDGEEARPQAVAERHTSLLNRSLIFRMQAEEEETRFRMLETVREFCLDRVNEAGSQADVCDRHVRWALGLAETASGELAGPNQKTWLNSLEREHDNLRAALHWTLESGQAESGLRLAGALWRFWHIRGYLEEGLSWLERMLALQFEPGSPAHIKALGGAGSIANQRADYKRAWALFEEKRRLCEAAGDQREMASALASMGTIAKSEGHIEHARALYEKSLSLFRECADRRGVALTLANMVNVACSEEDYAAARRLHEESLAVFREIGDLQNVALAQNNMASTLINMGDLSSARSLLVESLRLGRELNNLRTVAHSFTNFRGLAVKEGRACRAAVITGMDDALRERICLPIPPKARKAYEEVQAKLREQLGAEKFDEAYHCGRAMTLEQAVAYVVEEPENTA